LGGIKGLRHNDQCSRGRQLAVSHRDRQRDPTTGRACSDEIDEKRRVAEQPIASYLVRQIRT
jgi:hypothetical protein